MSAFFASIQAGLDRADAAASATSEIDSIIEDLRLDVESATRGAVALIFQAAKKSQPIHPERPVDEGPAPCRMLLQSTMSDELTIEIGSYQASLEGYPVITRAYGSITSAGDGESLRLVFSEMFERAETGRALKLLMSSAASLPGVAHDAFVNGDCSTGTACPASPHR